MTYACNQVPIIMYPVLGDFIINFQGGEGVKGWDSDAGTGILYCTPCPGRRVRSTDVLVEFYEFMT